MPPLVIFHKDKRIRQIQFHGHLLKEESESSRTSTREQEVVTPSRLEVNRCPIKKRYFKSKVGVAFLKINDN